MVEDFEKDRNGDRLIVIKGETTGEVKKRIKLKENGDEFQLVIEKKVML